MTKAERRAAFQVAYAAHKAAGGTLSEGAFASAQQSAVVALAPPAPVPAARPVATSAPARRFVDRVWSGGDRDSDDIYTVQS
jgi:hypothetical protein